MSEANQVPSGNDPQASGDAAANQNNANTETPKTVSHETYLRVLEQKKARDAELADLRKKEKERTEADLKAREDYKTMAENRQKELDEERTKRQNLEATLQRGAKVSALLDKVSGKIDEQYWPLLDLDKIAINPETGLPDEMSVQQVAREFEKKYSLVIQRGTSAGLPNTAAQGSATKLTYEEWVKLPLKEQKSRLKEVM